MAIATITDSEVKKPLKTAPPDGFVVIRRMTWGEKLKVKAMSAEMVMKLGDKKKGEDAEALIQMMEDKVSEWEFGNLIMDHNLTDENQKPLNFKNIVDMRRIRGPIGQEISDYIREINDFEEDEETGN